MLAQQEKDNVVVWDGNKKGHYEVYYLKLNHKKSGTAYWIRYTLLSPLVNCGNPVAELWGIFFDSKNPKKNLAFKKTFAVNDAKFSKDNFLFQIKLRPLVTLPLSLFYLVYKKQKYFFNSIAAGIRNKGNFKDDTYTFTAKGKEIILQGKVFASGENFVGVEYTDPDGEHLYCNNTKVANCEIIILNKKNNQEIGKLTSNNTTALEFVSRKKDERVEVRI